MTKQDEMKNKLLSLGIPAKEIKCYGSQIMITVLGKETSEKWQMTLNKICRRVLSTKTIDYANRILELA